MLALSRGELSFRAIPLTGSICSVGVMILPSFPVIQRQAAGDPHSSREINGLPRRMRCGADNGATSFILLGRLAPLHAVHSFGASGPKCIAAGLGPGPSNQYRCGSLACVGLIGLYHRVLLFR